jgi:ABC-type transporter Mla subunit MlaD
LTDNYIEIATGTQSAPLAPPGSELPSAEAFGLPQLGDAAQAMLPDIHNALQKVNQSLDGLQITIARANDLLNDRNRATIGSSLDNVNHLVADARPKVTDSLNNLNGLLNDARPKVSTSLSNVQDLTRDLNARLGPLLDDVKTITARANDTLSHVDSTLLENRPDIRATVVRLRDTMAQLNQTLDQNSANIDELLDNIRISTENLRSLTETLERAPASLIRGIKVPERKPGGPN